MRLHSYSKQLCPYCSGDLFVSRNWFGNIRSISCKTCHYMFKSEEEYLAALQHKKEQLDILFDELKIKIDHILGK